MNTEEAIRERHAFEDNVKRFLDLASAMSDRELEIALARLVDMLKGKKENAIQIQVRGEILNFYFDLRRSGTKTQKKLRRNAFLEEYPDNSEWLISRAANFNVAFRTCQAGRMGYGNNSLAR